MKVGDDPRTTISPVMFVDECLLDGERVQLFERAIRRQVQTGDLVVDAGTGCGILALLSAEAGAGLVVAIEIDEDVFGLAQEALGGTRHGSTIKVVRADVREFSLDGQAADVVVMEMLDTGLVAEHQGPAIAALHRSGVIGPRTRVIPQGVRCTVELVEYDFNFYGFDLRFPIQARDGGVLSRVRRALSERRIYADLDFRQEPPDAIDELITCPILKSGEVDALLFRTETVLDEHESSWETSDMNMPAIVPVSPKTVTAGASVEARLNYVLGGGFSSVRAEITAA